MPTLDTALPFLALSLMLSFAPGPDNVFVLLQSATHGRRAGLWVVLGLCTGLVIHTAAVALGLAALFATSALAFTAVKAVGAAYLVYLAWQVLRAPVGELSSSALASPSAASMVARGVLMNLTNPKVLMFFLAFLPQFVHAEQGHVGLQVMALGGLFILATLLAFGLITWFAATLGQLFRRSTRAQLLLNRITGVVFLGLAAKLALSQR
jgi:threonine/homoserine/homoserine lactone efflux protein